MGPSRTSRVTWSPTSRATSPPGASACRPSAAGGRRRLGRAGVGHPRRGRPGARPGRPEGQGARGALPRSRSAPATRAGRDHLGDRPPLAPSPRSRPARRPSTRPTSRRRLAGLRRLPHPLPRHGCAFGDHLYVPWDTKLARSAKPYFLIQLCAYADLLEKSRASGPRRWSSSSATAPSGTSRPTTSSTTTSSSGGRFLDFQAAWDRSPHPDPGLDRSWGRWSNTAEKLLAESDHLSRVASITRGQVAAWRRPGSPPHRAGRLQARSPRPHGCRTPCSSGSEPRPAPARVARAHQPLWELRPAGARRAAPRAGAAAAAVGRRRVLRHGGLSLRRRRAGIPLGRRRQWTRARPDSTTGGPTTHTEEQAAFEAFIDWVTPAGSGDPTLHIYHYASYEASARQAADGEVRHPRGQGGRSAPPRRLRGPVRHRAPGLIIGTPSYSLKDDRAAVLAVARGDVVSATGSVIEYQRWMDSGEPRRWEESPILERDPRLQPGGLRVHLAAADWLLERQRESGIAYVPEPRGARAAGEQPKSARPPKRWRSGCSSGAEPGRAERRRPARPAARLAGGVPPAGGEADVVADVRSPRQDGGRAVRGSDCLASLTRTATPARAIKKSSGLEYRFDPDQDTKLDGRRRLLRAGTELKCGSLRLDEEAVWWS